MNTFGRLFKISIFGESHGPSVGISIDGCPAGLDLSTEDFLTDMERRKGGMQKGTTPRKEDDVPVFLSGLFNGKTTGAPLAIIFENNNTRSADYEKQRAVPRPGHADFVASKKFGGFEDYRGGGHFSGRLTACLVGAGVVAKKILSIYPHPSPKEGSFDRDSIGKSSTRSEITISSKIISIAGQDSVDAGLQKAIEAKDSVGGVVECVVSGLPVGLGAPFFDSVESLIGHAVFSIPAIKGIEFGAGFKAAAMFGSEHNDAQMNAEGKTETNYAGGVVGGLTNGADLVFRVVVKPTSSTPKEQQTWNNETESVEGFSVKGRHDLCIALRVPPVLEAVTAMVLADLMMIERRIPTILA